ncbi:MAG: hypothetical protein CMG21_03095 [Candidatus Marinimicrobia bacterium]|nr:hypothetical protein [Candidatus Neomarinimicrobiota bacterium]|tara:strand:+ start:575 stop:1099 length:525 start_codon:yes stop_codon:yes gene_type:complete
MKKIFILLIIGLGFGQFSMGTISTGAIADYTYYKDSSHPIHILDIQPEFSYFTTHNVSVDFSTRIRMRTYSDIDSCSYCENSTEKDYGVSLSYYMPNYIYFGAGIVKEQMGYDEEEFYDMDYKLHSGFLARLSNNIFIDFRFWLETQEGSGFDGFSDDQYRYGFDIGIKGFTLR